jgi:hypothetical protein
MLSAIKLRCIFSAEHNIVNLDASSWRMSCDESSVPMPSYTAPSHMLCCNLFTGDRTPPSNVARSMVNSSNQKSFVYQHLTDCSPFCLISWQGDSEIAISDIKSLESREE